MSAITLESLGLSKDDIQERVIDRLVSGLMREYSSDEDGEPVFSGKTTFASEMERRIKDRIDAAIDDIAGRNVLPNVASYVEGLCLQETNKWGEKSGKSVTFVEYLVQRAEAYLQETVDFQGKPKSAGDSYSWKGAQTRLTHMVHEHLQYSIKTAMTEALQVATGGVAKALHETVRIQLNEVAAKLKVEVKA